MPIDRFGTTRLAALAAAGLCLLLPLSAPAAKEDLSHADAIQALAEEAAQPANDAEKYHIAAQAAVENLEKIPQFELGSGTAGLPAQWNVLAGKAAIAEWKDAEGIKGAQAGLQTRTAEVKERIESLSDGFRTALESFSKEKEVFDEKYGAAVNAKALGGKEAEHRFEALFSKVSLRMANREKDLTKTLRDRFDKAKKSCDRTLTELARTDAAITAAIAALKPPPPPPVNGGTPIVVITNVPRKVTVTFSSNGNILERSEVPPGSYVGRPSVEPTPQKWEKFVGWKVEHGDGSFVDPSRTTAPEEEGKAINFYAVFEPVRFPVCYAGSPDDAEKEVCLDDPLPKVPDPERAHWEFLGWARAADAGRPDVTPGKTRLKEAFDPERESRLDLHPVWKPVFYTVRFLTRTEASREPVETTTGRGSVQDPVPRPDDPAPVGGLRFEGWSAAGSESPYDFGAPVEGDFDLVARWTAIPRVVEYLDFEGGVFSRASGSVDEPVSAPSETPSRVGSAFVHWSESPDGPAWDGFGKPLLADVRLYPVGEDKVFDVTFDTKTDVPIPAQRVVYGAPAVRPADPEPPRSGVRFVGWRRATDATPGAAAYDFAAPVTEPLALVALWKIDSGVRVGPSAGPSAKFSFGAAMSRATSWCEARGVTTDVAWIVAGVLFLLLLIELVALARRR